MIMIMFLGAGVQCKIIFSSSDCCCSSAAIDAVDRLRRASAPTGAQMDVLCTPPRLLLALVAQDGDFVRSLLGTGPEFCYRTWTV